MNDTTIIIAGGTVVCEDTVLSDHDVYIRNGRIADIRPSANDVEQNLSGAYTPTIIDAHGAYVAPGMIDVHSDYIENVASPRPSVVMDMHTSLIEADRELATHGITTMFHSLSVYQALVFDAKPIRNFENVIKLTNEVLRAKSVEEKAFLIRHRLHLRVEIDSIDRYGEIKDLVESGGVDMLSFMDHTPGQGQYADTELFGDTLKGYRDLSDEQVADIIKMQQNSNKLSPDQMLMLSELARDRGIAVASHDDDSLAKLDAMERLKVAISEFPITLDIAKSAQSRGMYTLAGAPNVLMGRSHSGNLSAREAIEEGAIDILCSDYYPSALLGAVFILHHEVGLSLDKAFALVTSNPAQAAGIANEVGSIAVGKRADIIVVRELPTGVGSLAKPVPVVTNVLVGGNCVHQNHYPVMKKSTAAPLLEIKGLSKSFTIHAIDRHIKGCKDINITLMPGEFVGITGKSGSGKSTILRSVYRTNLPESGSIYYDSKAFGRLDLSQATQRQMVYLRTNEIGYVSQFLNILPRRSAYDIVMQSALEAYGRDAEDLCHQQTKFMLRHFAISEDLWDVHPRTFSGGEKLRLNIAAAMIKKPRLLLLDEPTASLDNASKAKVRDLIEQLKDGGTTMLGIFHDLEFMEGLCDKEFNMQEGAIA